MIIFLKKIEESESIFTIFRGYEIMFHVATMLPHDDDDDQQVHYAIVDTHLTA